MLYDDESMLYAIQYAQDSTAHSIRYYENATNQQTDYPNSTRHTNEPYEPYEAYTSETPPNIPECMNPHSVCFLPSWIVVRIFEHVNI